MKTGIAPIYLDNQATTRVDPRVAEAMLPFLTEVYGNPASRQHAFGWAAEAAVETARGRIARLIGAAAAEVVFTSGATESINLALKGVAEGLGGSGNHIITGATEHSATLDTCAELSRAGFEVTVLPVDRYGLVTAEAVDRALTARTILVSVMMANNEIGTIAPVGLIGALCRRRGVLFHSDATQAVGKVPVDVDALCLDLLSCSAHKMYGPKGVGALYVRAGKTRANMAPQMRGGGHEGGLRSGTVNVPGIVGFGVAAEIAMVEMPVERDRTSTLRDRLASAILAGLEDVHMNGHPVDRLPNNCHLTFAGAPTDALLLALPDIAFSTGSACSSATARPSHVLEAIGLSREEAGASARFGVGRFTTTDEVNRAAGRIISAVRAVRIRRSARLPGVLEPLNHEREQ